MGTGLGKSIIIIPILQRSKLKFTEVREFVPRHSQWLSQNEILRTFHCPSNEPGSSQKLGKGEDTR